MTGRSVDDLATELARVRREFDDFRSTALARFPSSDRLKGAQHHWSGSGSISHDDEETQTSWSTVIDGGIATRSGGNFLLNRTGRWAIILAVSSDATVSGVMTARLVWPSGAFGLNAIEDTRYRGGGLPGVGGGFPGSGALAQSLTWSGWVDTGTDSAITCQMYWNASDTSTSADIGYRLSLNYMGLA